MSEHIQQAMSLLVFAGHLPTGNLFTMYLYCIGIIRLQKLLLFEDAQMFKTANQQKRAWQRGCTCSIWWQHRGSSWMRSQRIWRDQSRGSWECNPIAPRCCSASGLCSRGWIFENIWLGSPMDDASEVEVLDATEHLVEEVGHPLVVQVHVDHLVQQVQYFVKRWTEYMNTVVVCKI